MRSKRFSLRPGLGGQISWWCCLAALLWLPRVQAQTNEVDPALAATPFRGETSCSSSGCHGGAGEKHDQCLRWSKLDVHTRSFATLTLARSARIAEVLKIGDPVQSASCTVCHAPYQTIATNEVLRKALDPAAGVSCENCHGPAEKWLLSHTRADFTHQDRVNAGLRDLNNLYVRANSCVACHQNVDTNLLAAGHPELIFELDGQAVTEKKHWRESTNWSGPQTWLVGQAVALREMSWQFGREASPSENSFNRWSALFWLLQTTAPADAALPAVPAGLIHHRPRNPGLAAQLAEPMQMWSDSFAREAAASWPADATLKCLNLLAATAADFRDAAVPDALQGRRAERLVLGLDRLVNGLNDDALAQRVNAPLGKLFKDAQSLPDFNPKQFADDLETFQKAIAATR